MKITNANGVFFVPDEIGNDPAKTQAEVAAAAVPWDVYESQLLQAQLGEKLAAISTSVMQMYTVICDRDNVDPMGLDIEFLSNHDSWITPLYTHGLIPAEVMDANADVFEEHYQSNED